MGSKGAGQQTTTTNNTPWSGIQPSLTNLYGLSNQWLLGGNAPELSAATAPASSGGGGGGGGKFGKTLLGRANKAVSSNAMSNTLAGGLRNTLDSNSMRNSLMATPLGALGVPNKMGGYTFSDPLTGAQSQSPQYADLVSAARSNIAGINPNLQAAWDRQVAQANAGTSWLPELNTAYSNMITGDYTEDPLFKYQSDLLARKFNESTLPALNAAFSSGGRTGGGTQALAYGQNANELANALSGLSAQTYNQAKQRQIQAMNMAPMVQQLPYYDINQLGSVGEAQRAYEQQLLSAPYQQLAQYASLLSPGLGFGTQTSTTPLYKNPMAGAAGGAIAGGSMFGPYGALGGALLGYLGSA